MKKNIFAMIIAILLPLVIGGLSAFLTGDKLQLYPEITKPALSPPAAVFPIAWTVLYLLMGISSYLIWTTEAAASRKDIAFSLYLIQLVMNFFWSIIFFRLGMYTAALVWLIIMYMAIVLCTVYFFLINPKAGWLMIPYNLWMGFATYLNLSIVMLNS